MTTFPNPVRLLGYIGMILAVLGCLLVIAGAASGWVLPIAVVVALVSDQAIKYDTHQNPSQTA